MAQAPNSGRSRAEQVTIRQVVARLSQQLRELSTDDINGAVHGQYDRFNDSPIRDFVPVFVERATRQLLTQDRARRRPG